MNNKVDKTIKHKALFILDRNTKKLEVRYLCNRAVRANEWRLTTEDKEVTCTNCLNRIKWNGEEDAE